MSRFLWRYALLFFIAVAWCLPLTRVARAAETIPGIAVSYNGTVPIRAFLRKSPGPNGTTHFDIWEVQHGRVVTAYDVDMTKFLHTIVVSDDLVDFRHVHLVLQTNGHFMIDLNLPHAGAGYHVYIDGLPHAIGRQVFRFDIPGPAVTASAFRQLHAPGGTVQVGPYSVTISPTKVPIGEISTVAVSIFKNGRPANDLHPYLGVMSHGVFVGVKDLAYMHAHGMSAAMLNANSATDCGDSMMAAMTPMPPDLNIGYQFEFQILAPSAQPYDFWLQFIGGKTLYTAPFLVTTI